MQQEAPDQWHIITWLNRNQSRARVLFFRWKDEDNNWNQTLRRLTQGFVVGSYLLFAAWSLTNLLNGLDIHLLLFGFYFAGICAVGLLLNYRSNDPTKFRTLLHPSIWAVLMFLSAGVAVESLLNGYDRTAILSGVFGATGALLPLAVKALNDMWMERLKRRNATLQEPSITPPPS